MRSIIALPKITLVRLVIVVIRYRRIVDLGGEESWIATLWFVRHTDVVALNGGLGGTETQTDILVVAASALARLRRLDLGLRV